MVHIFPHPPEPVFPHLAQEYSPYAIIASSKCLPVAALLYGHLGLEYIPGKSHLPQSQTLMFRLVVKHCLGIYMPQLSQNASWDQN